MDGLALLLPLLLGLGLAALAGISGGDDDPEVEPETPDPDTVEGNAGAENLLGGDGPSTIFALGGADTVSAGAGNDTVTGGSGFDFLSGELGDDKLFGDEGRDLLDGGPGNDSLTGGKWDDILVGGDGDDTLTGQEGDDFLLGNAGDDLLKGGQADDVLFGGSGEDDLRAGIGDDIVVGSQLGARDLTLEELEFAQKNPEDVEGDGFADFDPKLFVDDLQKDILKAEGGNDDLVVGALDEATGGDGFDSFYVGLAGAESGAAIIKDYSPDEDNILLVCEGDCEEDPSVEVQSDGADALIYVDGVLTTIVEGAAATLTVGDIAVAGEGTEDLVTASLVSGTTPPAEPEDPGDEERVQVGTDSGDGERDFLEGDEGRDALFGRFGNDLLQGKGGDDRLFGQEDSDVIFGGTGDDLIRGGGGPDLIVDFEGEDTSFGGPEDDIFDSAGAVNEDALAAAIRSGVPTSDIFQPPTGDPIGDTLFGAGGSDAFLLADEDVASGGAGSDTYALGSWITDGKPALITDFEQGTDALEYYFEGPSAPLITQSFADGAITLSADGSAFVVLEGQSGPLADLVDVATRPMETFGLVNV